LLAEISSKHDFISLAKIIYNFKTNLRRLFL
jgi:hypothetical protein